MDRGSNGRFQKGNPGNPSATGRPRRSTEQSYLDATVGAVPLADWRKIVAKAVAQAKAGDAKAREWLGKMLVGSDPIPLAQLVEELQEELKRIRRDDYPTENGRAAVGGVPAEGAGDGPG